MGSVKPIVEFSIILGSKMNIETPIKLNVLLKNLLQRKNIGIAVSREKVIDVSLWINVFSRNVSALIVDKIIDTNAGQPLFDNAQSFGKLPISAIL